MQSIARQPQESNPMQDELRLIRHGKPLPLDPIEPESPASRAQARDAQEIQRAKGLAQLLASFEDIHDLWSQPEHIRRHFGNWALLVIRGAAFGPQQFRHTQKALAYAAQAAHDCDAAQQQYIALDLAAPRNHAEQFAWSLIAQRTIEAWRTCMWRNEATMPSCTEAHFVENRPEMEDTDDPRRI